MFGFFNKKKEKSSVPYITTSPLAAQTEETKLEAAIMKLRAGNRSAYPLFIKTLLKRSVTLLLKRPGELESCLIVHIDNQPYIAAFTNPLFTDLWLKHQYTHLLEIPVLQLCVRVTDDAVGLMINPEHPLLDFRLPAVAFRQLRGTVMTLLPPFKEGGIYYIRNEDGTYSVLKILKLDEGGIHVRQYSNLWPTPPASVDESGLFMRGPDRQPEEKLGVGHLPISKAGFHDWNATFVQQSTVSEEELEGYKMWLEAKGGYF